MQLCDCQTIQPIPLPRCLAVHTGSLHVRRRMQVFFAAHGVPFDEQRGIHLLEAHQFSLLQPLCDHLTTTERPQVRVAPWQNHPQDLWQAESLEVWCDRVATPWFVEASRHLLFHFQPIVDLKTGQVQAFEALVRASWQDRFLGAFPLLKAAVAHDQLHAFDALCRSTAITQGASKLPSGVGLFINFLPSVIYNPVVCLQSTFQTCERTGMDLSRLTFEVVESEAFPNLDLLKGILREYQQAGARVALDDLGGGHTSLLFLDRLQPDVVKLDRGLIQNLYADDPRTPLVSALIRYAHDLGVTVVAEGIETRQEFQLLRELGADLIQGYLLGKPSADPSYVLQTDLWS